MSSPRKNIKPVFTCPLSESSAQRQARLLQALAHPYRLQIIAFLKRYDKQMTVSDLVAYFGIEQSNVSHHLKVLRKAGLVACQRKGMYRMYSVQMGTLLEAYGAMWHERRERSA